MTHVNDCKNWKRLMPGQPDTCFNCINRHGHLVVGNPSDDCKNFNTKTLATIVNEQRAEDARKLFIFDEILRQRNELLKALEQLYDALPDIEDIVYPLGKRACEARGLINFCKEYDNRNTPA